MYFFWPKSIASDLEKICMHIWRYFSSREWLKILILFDDQSINSIRKCDGRELKWLTDNKKSNTHR